MKSKQTIPKICYVKAWYDNNSYVKVKSLVNENVIIFETHTFILEVKTKDHIFLDDQDYKRFISSISRLLNLLDSERSKVLLDNTYRLIKVYPGLTLETDELKLIIDRIKARKNDEDFY